MFVVILVYTGQVAVPLKEKHIVGGWRGEILAPDKSIQTKELFPGMPCVGRKSGRSYPLPFGPLI